MNIGHYAKSIVMIFAAGVGILVSAVSDNVVTPTEYTNIAIALVAAVGVYLIPNLPAGPARFAKSIVAFGGAALAALLTILNSTLGWSEVTTSDWLTVLLAGLGAIGLYIIPNESPIPTVVSVGPKSPLVSEAEEQSKTI